MDVTALYVVAVRAESCLVDHLCERVFFFTSELSNKGVFRSVSSHCELSVCVLLLHTLKRKQHYIHTLYIATFKEPLLWDL